MDGSEVDTEARATRGVRHGRVHLGSREENDASNWSDDPHLGIEFQRLGGLWLLAGLRFDVLRSCASALLVPAVVVVLARRVWHGLAPVARMESHDVL